MCMNWTEDIKKCVLLVQNVTKILFCMCCCISNSLLNVISQSWKRSCGQIELGSLLWPLSSPSGILSWSLPYFCFWHTVGACSTFVERKLNQHRQHTIGDGALHCWPRFHSWCHIWYSKKLREWLLSGNPEVTPEYRHTVAQKQKLKKEKESKSLEAILDSYAYALSETTFL